MTDNSIESKPTGQKLSVISNETPKPTRGPSVPLYKIDHWLEEISLPLSNHSKDSK